VKKDAYTREEGRERKALISSERVHLPRSSGDVADTATDCQDDEDGGHGRSSAVAVSYAGKDLNVGVAGWAPERGGVACEGAESEAEGDEHDEAHEAV